MHNDALQYQSVGQAGLGCQMPPPFLAIAALSSFSLDWKRRPERIKRRVDWGTGLGAPDSEPTTLSPPCILIYFVPIFLSDPGGEPVEVKGLIEVGTPHTTLLPKTTGSVCLRMNRPKNFNPAVLNFKSRI